MYYKLVQKNGRSIVVMMFALFMLPLTVFADNKHPLQDINDVAAIEAEITRLISSDYPANFRASDVNQWPAMFSEDAVVLLSGRPTLSGRDEIRKFNIEAHKRMSVEQLDVVVRGVRVSGNWALCWGDFIEQATLLETKEIDKRGGRFLVVWERQDDGSWKIIADMGNSALVHGR